MKRFFTSKKGIVALLAVAVVAIASVGAYAYWTQGGSGSGSATAGTTTDITVNQTSTSAATLYPGGPVEALSGTFTNPNASPVNIGSVTAIVSSVTGGGTPDADHPACTTADFEIGGTSGPYPAVVTGSTWSGLNVRLVESGSNQDTCKSAVAHITYTAHAGV